MRTPVTDDKRRPRTLADAMRLGNEHGEHGAYVREFLDAFYGMEDGEERAAAISMEPPHASARTDAYVAAVAEHLAIQYDLPIPDWTHAEDRFLDLAWFPTGLESLKATQIIESPSAFRRRLIFVDADPLYRPRRQEPLGTAVGYR